MSEASETKSLLEFLAENPVDDLKEQVIVSKRLKKYPFTVTAMTGEQFSTYQNKATIIGKKQKIDYDNKCFNEQVVLNHVVEDDGRPFFKLQDNIKKVGCKTPEEFLYRFLTAGEIVELVSKISALSGFDVDEEEMAKEVKKA